MSFTMREKGATALRLVSIWVLATLFAAAAGPFGTFEGLGLLGRLGYWAVIVGVSIVLAKLQLIMLQGKPSIVRFASQFPYAVLLATMTHGLNLLIFPNWGGWSDFGFLALVILSVILMIEAAVFLVRIYVTKQEDDPGQPHSVSEQREETVLEPEGAALFQRRLALDKRGALIRLESQDHYLLVVTERGSETLLMRLGDASDELGDTGLRVHRSHWINGTQVLRHSRQKGRDFLEMSDGAQVPVSRSYRAAVQAAGLL